MGLARQAGNMLSTQPLVAKDGVVPLLETVIERMADGQMAAFASRYGFSKSGVWHWVGKGGLPNLKAWLTIALNGGIGLDQLFAGEVDGWQVPVEAPQMSIPLATSPRTGIKSRMLDWTAICSELQAILALPVPISINEACERVGVGRKHLYLRANAEARAIADRHSRYRTTVRLQRETELRERISKILDERLTAGYEGMSARDIWAQLDTEAQSVSGIFGHISLVLTTKRP